MATKPNRGPGLGEYAACYALYLVLLVLCGVTFFLLWDALQWLVPVVLGWERMVAAGFTVDLATVLIGALLFVFMLWAEPYFRAGVTQGDLRRRFLRLAMPLVVTSVVAYFVPVVLVFLTRGGPL